MSDRMWVAGVKANGAPWHKAFTQKPEFHAYQYSEYVLASEANARIKALEGENGNFKRLDEATNSQLSEWQQKAIDWQSRADAAEARVKRLVEALKPFAVRCDDAVRPDDMDNDGLTVRVGHLRGARAILKEIGNE